VLTTLAVENYRSLRHLVVPVRRLTAITGANGTGKSSLYRAVRLLAESSRNGAVAALAREGGLPSTLWAGPEHIGRGVRSGEGPVQGTVRTRPISLKLGFASAHETGDFGYAMDLGLPTPGNSAFGLDPEIKRECVWSGPVLRPSALLADRQGPAVRLRTSAGVWSTRQYGLERFDSMLSHAAGTSDAPELMALRERIRSWRFYDHFRTDAGSPARTPQVGTFTPALTHDGADLPAALETIREIGNAPALDHAVNRAFPGSHVEIDSTAGRFELHLHQPGLLRPLTAAELSEGTLRYLLLVAALLTPRPPELIVINEPETSLHPDLLPALAELMVTAAGTAQIVTVSHSRRLVDDLREHSADTGLDFQAVELTTDFGQTVMVGQRMLDEPSWHWPSR
jgi:predicted ATPase